MKNRILIIDDDKDVCNVLEKNFGDFGFDITSVYNGEDGLARLKNDSYDLVLLDLRLPNQDGLEILKSIRDFNHEIIVIILTAYPSLETSIATLKKYRVSDYLCKPFNIIQLKNIIHREIQQKLKEDAKLINLTEIGKQIKDLRVKKGISLEMLGAKTGLSKGFLSEFERQKKRPRLDTLKKISEVLGVNIYFFVKE